MVKELRLAGISDIEAANAFLPTFMQDYNRRFAKSPQNPADAHRPVRVLNVSLAASKDAMVKGMEDGAQAAADQVLAGVEPVIRRMEKQSKQVAAMNIAAAVTALIAAGLALLSSI